MKIVTEKATDRPDLPHPFEDGPLGLCRLCDQAPDGRLHKLIVPESAAASTIITEKGI